MQILLVNNLNLNDYHYNFKSKWMVLNYLGKYYKYHRINDIALSLGGVPKVGVKPIHNTKYKVRILGAFVKIVSHTHHCCNIYSD